MSAPTRPPSGPGRRSVPVAGTAARRAARQQLRTEAGSGRRAGSAPGSAEPGHAPTSVSSGGGRRDLDPDALAALEEQRDFLLRSLRDLDLEHAAGDLADEDYEALKDDYTARAAVVLRAIDGHRTAMAARPRAGRGRRWAVGVAVVVAAVVAGLVMAQATGRRTAGGSVSGDSRQDSRELLSTAQSQTAQANQALDQGDTAAAVDHFKAALKAYDDALAADPLNAEAMTYRGWLVHTLALNGPTDQRSSLDAEAMHWLDQAITAQPGYADPLVFKAILLRNSGHPDEARAVLAQVNPTQVPPYMRSMVDSLRTSLGATPPGSAGAAANPSATTAPPVVGGDGGA